MARPDLVIISDLHLGSGGRRDDFLADDELAFERFMDELGRHTPLELIVNGDFIDFAQIQPRPHMWLDDRLGASEQDSVEKLQCAIGAHPRAFDALQRFVAHGGSVRFHYGNHDIDLVWPQIQAAIRRRLARALDDYKAVNFGWVYAVDGVYIEHGHQADPPNSFADMRTVIHPDSLGVPRLERCWGVRLVEEFFNEIEQLDGLDMLDNVRPIFRGAAIAIGYGLWRPAMYPALHCGLRVIWQTLAELKTDDDVRFAAEQSGLPLAMLRLLAGAAGFLGVEPAEAPGPAPRWLARENRVAPSPPHAVFSTDGRAATGREVGELEASGGAPAPRSDQHQAPLLREAYRVGRRLSGDPQQLHRALNVPALPALSPRPAHTGGSDHAAETGAAMYYARANQRFLQRAERIAAARPGLAAICFGHTHVPTEAGLRVDNLSGWPLGETTCRYYNSGSWTPSLNLQDLRWSSATFDDLRNPANYVVARTMVHMRWDGDGGLPAVTMRRWSAVSGVEEV